MGHTHVERAGGTKRGASPNGSVGQPASDLARRHTQARTRSTVGLTELDTEHSDAGGAGGVGVARPGSPVDVRVEGESVIARVHGGAVGDGNVEAAQDTSRHLALQARGRHPLGSGGVRATDTDRLGPGDGRIGTEVDTGKGHAETTSGRRVAPVGQSSVDRDGRVEAEAVVKGPDALCDGEDKVGGELTHVGAASDSCLRQPPGLLDASLPNAGAAGAVFCRGEGQADESDVGVAGSRSVGRDDAARGRSLERHEVGRGAEGASHREHRGARVAEAVGHAGGCRGV
mmetsp:Transcript_20902/g.48838  ORF Transcript_20902/g.48838 Transcript_20902/m.48838 type:complete len:287 (-) Transcript_20902:820-1680(-)